MLARTNFGSADLGRYGEAEDEIAHMQTPDDRVDHARFARLLRHVQFAASTGTADVAARGGHVRVSDEKLWRLCLSPCRSERDRPVTVAT
jgi:hypothetical protein